MGNSIRRARARPRVRSINWRTFKWLLPRVVVARLIESDDAYQGRELIIQRWLTSAPTWRVVKFAEHLLVNDPRRRFRP